MKNLRWIIDIRAVVQNIDSNLNLCDYPRESLLSALIGFHSFTGCDTVSAFAGRRKIKPLKLMIKTREYIEIFASLGKGTDFDDELLNGLNRFVCHMYGWKGNDSVNEIRYRISCESWGKIACEKLPPCEDVLKLHILRANYSTAIGSINIFITSFLPIFYHYLPFYHFCR